MSSFIKNLDWRFATKQFDTEKKVKKEDLEIILESIRMTPTSFGLQPLHVYVISAQKLKDKIKIRSFLQPQVAECSHLLIFCAETDVDKRIKQYLKEVEKGLGVKEKLKLQGLKMRMLGWLKTKSEEEVKSWAMNQAYIALGFAMAACAELKVDSCPMEGFVPAQVDKLLKLPKNHKSVVFLALGQRKENPKREKIRLKNTELFTHL